MAVLGGAFLFHLENELDCGMGYSGALFLTSIILAPLVVLIAAALFFVVRKLGCVPKGWRGLPSYALIGCGCYALLYLASSMQVMIVEPAALQKKYLGQAYGGPLELRRFEHWGFQDPGSMWVYALPPQALADLRQRCRPGKTALDRHRCHLYSGSDERWFADVYLEGGKLHMVDGLH